MGVDGWMDGRTDGWMDGCMEVWFYLMFLVDRSTERETERGRDIFCLLAGADVVRSVFLKAEKNALESELHSLKPKVGECFGSSHLVFGASDEIPSYPG